MFLCSEQHLQGSLILPHGCGPHTRCANHDSQNAVMPLQSIVTVPLSLIHDPRYPTTTRALLGKLDVSKFGRGGGMEEGLDWYVGQEEQSSCGVHER